MKTSDDEDFVKIILPRGTKLVKAYLKKRKSFSPPFSERYACLRQAATLSCRLTPPFSYGKPPEPRGVKVFEVS
jgi:hypothetical protein